MSFAQAFQRDGTCRGLRQLQQGTRRRDDLSGEALRCQPRQGSCAFGGGACQENCADAGDFLARQAREAAVLRHAAVHEKSCAGASCVHEEAAPAVLAASARNFHSDHTVFPSRSGVFLLNPPLLYAKKCAPAISGAYRLCKIQVRRGARRLGLPPYPAFSFDFAPIPPTPFPTGRGRFKVISCKGLRPLHPRS